MLPVCLTLHLGTIQLTGSVKVFMVHRSHEISEIEF